MQMRKFGLRKSLFHFLRCFPYILIFATRRVIHLHSPRTNPLADNPLGGGHFTMTRK